MTLSMKHYLSRIFLKRARAMTVPKRLVVAVFIVQIVSTICALQRFYIDRRISNPLYRISLFQSPYKTSGEFIPHPGVPEPHYLQFYCQESPAPKRWIACDRNVAYSISSSLRSLEGMVAINELFCWMCVYTGSKSARERVIENLFCRNDAFRAALGCQGNYYGYKVRVDSSGQRAKEFHYQCPNSSGSPATPLSF